MNASLGGNATNARILEATDDEGFLDGGKGRSGVELFIEETFNIATTYVGTNDRNHGAPAVLYVE